MKKTLNSSILVLLVVVMIALSGFAILRFMPIVRVFVDSSFEELPPRIIDLSNKDSEYMIKLDTDQSTGLYTIAPVNQNNDGSFSANEDHPAFISSAPESLERYVNQRVKITGKIVWTLTYLKKPGFESKPAKTKGAAVQIDSITRVE